MKNIEAAQIIEKSQNKVIYITEDINLLNQTLLVGVGNILVFQGGKVTNGKLMGQNTLVLGKVDIANMIGTWYNYGNSNPATNLVIGRMYFNTDYNKPVYWNGTNWVEEDGAKAGVLRSGDWASRPDTAEIYVGFKYFCTDKQTAEGATNGIEIIHKGNNVWVDALGRVVS